MLFGLGAITKTHTATATLQLMEEGKLALDDAIGAYLSEFDHVDPPITIRQLLNHTSGVYNYTDNPDLVDYLIEDLEKFWKPEDVLETLVLEPLFKRGTRYSYSNTNYHLLGMIIEKITNNNVAKEIRARLLTPNGFNQTFLDAEETIDNKLSQPI